MFNGRGKIVVFDPSAKLMLGFDPGEKITAEKFSDKMRALKISEAIEECKREGRAVTKELIVPYGGGKVLRCGISPVKDAKDKIVGALIFLRDTPREKEVDRMKAEFISTVSHELRTPLSITKEGISLVLDGIPGEINREQDEILTVAKDNVDRLAHLINNLLDIARIDAGKAELKRKPVGLKRVVKQIVVSFKTRVKQKRLQMKTDLPMREIDVYVDEEKIVQVFRNLIENAIKFVEEGYIEVSVTEKKDMVECAVKDTGAGLSKDQIERAFDRFQQFGRVDGAGEKGTGIGLAITREIVEMHHGRMWVESRPGRGSSFIFTLPKYTSEQVFKEHVSTAVEEALFWDSKMSLVVVAVEDLNGGRKELLGKKIDLILNGIEAALRGSLRRKGDGAFRNSGDVMVILADCDRQQVINVKKRLELVLKDHLIRERLDKRIAMNFSCATFPDDGRTVEELIKKAEKALQGRGRWARKRY